MFIIILMKKINALVDTIEIFEQMHFFVLRNEMRVKENIEKYRNMNYNIFKRILK